MPRYRLNSKRPADELPTSLVPFDEASVELRPHGDQDGPEDSVPEEPEGKRIRRDPAISEPVYGRDGTGSHELRQVPEEDIPGSLRRQGLREVVRAAHPLRQVRPRHEEVVGVPAPQVGRKPTKAATIQRCQ